jgi:hypothetical protein
LADGPVPFHYSSKPMIEDLMASPNEGRK